MIGVLALFSLVGGLVATVYGVSSLLSPAPLAAGLLPFESGMTPQQHAVSRYHVRWYAITVLFLAFDMEAFFMFPWAVVVADVGTSAVVEMFGFLAVLLAGVVYVWREGALRWT